MYEIWKSLVLSVQNYFFSISLSMLFAAVLTLVSPRMINGLLIATRLLCQRQGSFSKKPSYKDKTFSVLGRPQIKLNQLKSYVFLRQQIQPTPGPHWKACALGTSPTLLTLSSLYSFTTTRLQRQCVGPPLCNQLPTQILIPTYSNPETCTEKW